jgi:hypothetical protein
MPTAKKTVEEGGMITLRRLPIERIQVRILGLSPLIPHRWDEKSKRMFPGHPNPLPPVERKSTRNPEAEAHASVYWLDDGRPAMPATAFKAAMVGACRLFKELTMVEAKQLFFVEGELFGSDQFVPFSYKGDPVLREDTPRIDNGRSTDLRYRYAFFPWWATLTIRYIASNISADSIFTLVDAAGNGGVGDWRPSAPKSSTGTFGTFRVMTDNEAEEYNA